MATKSANNATELNYVSYIPANNSINFTVQVLSNGAPIADVTAGVYANAAFETANGAYAAANNVAPQIQPAFDQANGAFSQANGAYAAANNAGGIAAIPTILMLSGM